MRRFFFFSFALCVAASLFSSRSTAEPPAKVVVVAVEGEPLDPARVREAIGRELSVTAVGPEDPRASSATGHLEVRGRPSDRTLTVTYRKLDTPVTRTVELPEEPARAETVAVFIAGNVARDEATELLPKPRPAPTPPPAPTGAGTRPDPANERASVELATARAMLIASERESARRRDWFGGTMLVTAGAMLTPQIYLSAAGESTSREASAVAGAQVGLAITLGVYGTVMLLGETSERSVLPITRGSSIEDPVDTVLRLDAAWSKEAQAARSNRKTFGTLAFVMAGANAAAATIHLATSGSNDDAYARPVVGYATGALFALAGAYLVSTESPIESSYRSWRTLKDASRPPSNTSAVAVAVAPTPGGVTASLGFEF